MVGRNEFLSAITLNHVPPIHYRDDMNLSDDQIKLGLLVIYFGLSLMNIIWAIIAFKLYMYSKRTRIALKVLENEVRDLKKELEAIKKKGKKK
jgi:hypothetical protein